jgi:ribosomal protein S18 acetylase RimI-like enzyme
MTGVQFRKANRGDLDNLLMLEEACFQSDRLSRRSFRHWIEAPHGILFVAESNGGLLGYGLVWCHRGTRLARLYSLAVYSASRGTGVARQLLEQLESAAAECGHFFMRLEVAKSNLAAIGLYQRLGYTVFGEYRHYYEDDSDALRMQKKIQRFDTSTLERPIPWYCQTTQFTCGPAALMMAMAGLDTNIQLDQATELDIWREATTIYMTSGHGGCHPVGLGLAAQSRGFDVEVYLNTRDPLFLDGVRSADKKSVMETVHNRFLEKAREQQMDIVYADIDQSQIKDWLQAGYGVLVLISSYRLDRRKSPHWVTVTNIDEHCMYVHDPDNSALNQQAFDCQHVPIAREDFAMMSSFGVARLRTAIAIRKPPAGSKAPTR